MPISERRTTNPNAHRSAAGAGSPHGSEDHSHQPRSAAHAPGYHHITVVESGRTAFLAGQCPLDVSGTLVGAGDIDVQIDQVASNAAIALAAVGAQPSHVVRSVVYVVSDDTAVLAAAWRRLTRSVIAPAFTTASSLVGVARLGFPGQLIEIDLTAALFG